MDVKDILELVHGIDDLSLLEIEEEGFKIKIKRGTAQQVVMAAPAVMPQVTAMPQAAAPIMPAAASEAVPAETSDKPAHGYENAKDVVSPLVGIFHELEGDNAVKIGTKLKKGDVICSVEAMKLMNDIKMPEDGEIVWIAVSEGDAVEYDQVLYHYI